MGFTDAVKSVFSKYATFSGRARRSEYWYFYLFVTLVELVLSVLSTFLGQLALGLSGIWALAILVPELAVLWRRLHDTGRSGAWAFIIFVPLVGWIILLVFLCRDSQPGDNQYGPNPKGYY